MTVTSSFISGTNFRINHSHYSLYYCILAFTYSCRKLRMSTFLNKDQWWWWSTVQLQIFQLQSSCKLTHQVLQRLLNALLNHLVPNWVCLSQNKQQINRFLSNLVTILTNSVKQDFSELTYTNTYWHCCTLHSFIKEKVIQLTLKLQRIRYNT